jgi:Ni,Fe-hydrogenase I cytochrome b subunit
MSGIILITVPTIQYGGYFLLTSLINRSSEYLDNSLRQNFFRVGHAHAGVIVLLSLILRVARVGLQQMIVSGSSWATEANRPRSKRRGTQRNAEIARILSGY